MDFYRNTAYKVWHDLWRLRLKHSLSASNFKAKIALVYKWKAFSCVYVREKMQRLNNIHVYLGQGLHCSQVTCYACFSVVCYILLKTTLNFSGIPSKCQTVWIQIKPDILSCLIWVQLICKGYQRPTLVSRQIYAITAKISWAGPNMTMVFKRLIIFASQGY